MSKSKKVTVSKKQLAETGEELEVVGALFEVEGAVEVAEGLEDLEVAQTGVRVGVAEVAAASSDLGMGRSCLPSLPRGLPRFP